MSSFREINKLLEPFTTFYLVVPAFFFAYGWLRTPFDIITIVSIAFIIFFIWKEIFNLFKERTWSLKTKVFSRSNAWVSAALFIVFIWTSFSGIGGLGFQNDDYRAKNALFHDLIIHNWPLVSPIDGRVTKIVYYFGYYLPAAAFGKFFNWDKANFFIFLWSLTGVFLAFYWFLFISQALSQKTGKTKLMLVLLFCFAGGLDFPSVHSIQKIPWETHVEVWAKYFQYSANTTLLYWVPQHAIPIWLITGLVVSSIYSGKISKYLGLALSASIIWSPFGLIGVAPYLIFLMFQYKFPKNIRKTINVQTVFFQIVAIWLGSIFSLYMISNSFSFPITLTWNLIKNKDEFAMLLLKFWLIEFGFIGYLLLVYLKIGSLIAKKKVNELATQTWFGSINRNGGLASQQFTLFIISLIILIVLPFYTIGVYNDLVMRSSIPALFVFWAVTGKILLHKTNDYPLKPNFLRGIITITIVAGFLTSSSEIYRSIKFYRFGAPSSETILSTENADKLELVRQRAGDENSFFYRYLGK